MFNVGDKVICVNNEGVKNALTIDKEYEILSINNNIVRVWDDKDRLFGYLDIRFELKEHRIVREEVW